MNQPTAPPPESHPRPAPGDYAVYAGADYPQTFGELLLWALARTPDAERRNCLRMVGQPPVTCAEFARQHVLFTDSEAAGCALPAGPQTSTHGEIEVRHLLGTDYLLRSCYKDAQRPRETLVDGYWHSGDSGLIDDQGSLRFLARLKDYLRIGGGNVSTRVVETAIRTPPPVTEVAVVGARKALGHDELVAHVAPCDGATLDATDFFRFCNQVLPCFMVPRFLVRQPALPKTATLRVEKYKLQQTGTDQAIDRQQLGLVLNR